MENLRCLNETLQKLPPNLEDMSKQDLIDTVEKFRNILNSSPKPAAITAKNATKSKGNFDFNRYKKRHVALKILYLGWEYGGFVVQDNTEETVESYLFKALMKTKLVDARETSNYNRCGRTDKGVSAFSQVISIDLRTNLLEGPGVFTPDGYSPDENRVSKEELDYPGMLNRVLPNQIRVFAWAPVDTTFSSRFDCVQRTYKYYFPKSNLNTDRMLQAAKLLIGEHDYRNLCKMDVGNGVTKYIRKIFNVDICPVSSNENGSYQMLEFTVVGSSFLWHQIRCIIAVLILVGQGNEEPQVVSQLLDVESNPQKPQYSMASEIPLVLFDCQYENLEWMYNDENIKNVINRLQNMWTHECAKSTIIKRMLEELETYCPMQQTNQADCLLMGVKSRSYKPLLERPVCDSLEDRIAHFEKKRKRSSTNENSIQSKNQRTICESPT